MTNFSTARGNMQDSAERAAHATGDVLRDKAAQASEALREGTERIRAEADTVARKAANRVSERPLMALTATLAIGAIAGYLLGRR
ncbi:MAG: hypothetical protein HYU58_01610 [Proteobacteria bacterium]|nr:hypothetical protein [Pseudomonadota bacterium]